MDKKEQRTLARAQRKAMGASARALASAALCGRLQQLPQVQGEAVILSYQAMPMEVTLQAFHAWAAARGIPVAFPVTGAAGAMEAYAPLPDTRWVRDGFGILTPVPETAQHIAPQALTLILTPCVAFDAGCHRLGQGGGYYDRYFPRCPQAMRLGIAFEAQRLPQLRCDPHDVPLHAVQTERTLYAPHPYRSPAK